jgi:D-alanine--poly(phosphoribitol) ligase subunit 1
VLTDIAKRVERCFELHSSRPALVIGGIPHTYADLRRRVLAIQQLLGTAARGDERLIGVAATDTLDTYAAVLAILRSGRAFVPLAAEHPPARNASIVKQAGLRTLLTTRQGVALDAAALDGVRVIATSDAVTAGLDGVAEPKAEDLAYLLFTSGSTGEPKGVPITRANLSAFLDALPAAGCALGEEDRVLQMFDLTFDFSIASYLAPLSHGACVFTVAPGNFKFAEVVRLLDEEKLTVAPMVPSVLTYLRPYFDEVSLPELRRSVFCGEALPADVTRGWSVCAPRTSIINFYGPTEATVFAMSYAWQPAARPSTA